MPSRVSTNAEERKKLVDSSLTVIRSKYQEVCSDYRHLGTKIFTLTATELAVVTFIFASDTHFNLGILYGAILFGAGIGAIVISTGLLFWAITSNSWASPGDISELEEINYRTNAEFLEYLKRDSLEAYLVCRKSFDKRRRMFDVAVMLFILGAILLMVLKFGGIKL